MNPKEKGPAGSEGEPRRSIGSGQGRAAETTRLQAIRIALCHDLVRAGRVLERRRMIVATEGNLSARLSTDRFVITRRGRRKGDLTTRDFVELGLNERPDSAALLHASSEYRLHQAGYRYRRDVEALLHAHPIGLTAYAVRGVAPDFARFDEARELVGPIGLIPYLPSGTSALAEAAGRALVGPGRPSLLLLQNHGALSVGATVDEALVRLEIAEHLAATLLAAERRA